MARIAVLGGNGYAGEGSALDGDVLDRVVADADVVLSALSPRGDMTGKVEGVVEDLVARLAGTPTRLGYIGGASSLLAEEGGPRLWDLTKDHIPDDVLPEVQTGLDTLAILETSPETLDWFYVSPPQDFGSWLGTASKGAYVRGGDVLLRDTAGASTISADDLALAILDEIEAPAHHRSRFTAIS